jgi:hypothetical protein
MVANTTHQLVRKRETITELFTHEDRHCKNWGVKGHSWRHQQWQMRARNFALKIQL